MSGIITTHALDLSKGKPAAGMRVELWMLDSPGEQSDVLGEFRLLSSAVLNEDGRADKPLVQKLELAGIYELRFKVRDYFGPLTPSFLDIVPIRFTVSDPEAHYHVPILVSPGGYSTYRGS